MITRLETSLPDMGGQGTATTGKSNTLLYIVIGIGILYLGYKFVYLPSKEKKENEDVK
jgi:hypothetical protein